MKATRLVSVMLVFVLFSAWGFAQPPEIEWNRRYGGTGDEYCAAVLPTPDGGYLLCGSTFPMGGMSVWDFLVVKTNANGDSLWSRTYGTDYWEECSSAQATIDGGFVLAGEQWSDSTLGFDFILLKIDAQGDCLWSQTYGGYAHDYCSAVLPTSDSGYLLVGTSLDIETGFSVGWLVKTDANGDSLWSRIYEGVEQAAIQSIQLAADHGYILAGTTGTTDQTSPRFWLLKINDNGDTLWSRIYSSLGPARCSDVRQTSDGGYILAGTTLRVQASDNEDFGLVKTDANGDSLWRRTYGGDSTHEYCHSVLQTADSGYFLVGEMLPPDVYNFDGWAMRTDADGDSLWSLRLSGIGDDRFDDMLQTADGGFILGGYSSDDSASLTPLNMWLVKLTPEMFAGKAPIPRSTCLLTNYPNPFNSTTVLEFAIPRTSRVTIRAYDILGRDAGTITDAVYGVGSQRIVWDGRNLASGVYWIRMSGEGFDLTRKAILLR